MKKSTHIALVATALASMMPAVAQDWQKLDQELVDNYESRSIAADFTGNNKMDIYHTGAYSTQWCKPFNYRIDNGCEVISSLLRNDGDNKFTLDWNYPVNYEDPTFNSDSYVEGQANNTYMRMPNHNIAPAGRGDFLALDYNNDGLVDLITFTRVEDSGWWYFWGADLRDDDGNRMEEGQYTPKRGKVLTLYQNLGDGRFKMVENSGIIELSSPDGEVSRALSAGDYDHDGYIDLLVSGNYHEAAYEEYVNEKHYYDSYTKLYRNCGKVADGEPQFKEMLIAETIGGVYTQQVNDDAGEIVYPKQELSGHFAPVRGNAQFADINNDGWLDVVMSGYIDNIWDGNYKEGTCIRIYINENGEKFKDVTDQYTLLEGVNNGSLVINDFNKDGSLDLMTAGYSWNLGGWRNLLYLNQNNESVYSVYLDGDADTGLPGSEKNRIFATDFDNDGNLDVYYASGLGRACIFYGTQSGTRFEEDGTGMESWKNSDSYVGTIGDFTGNGVADIYVPREREWDGSQAVYPNPNPAAIWLNKMVDNVEAPAAPTNVDYSVADGKINISWNYDTDAAISNNLAYNIYVRFDDNSVMTLVPADPETGYVRVTEGKQVALRPSITSYSISSGKGVSAVGVQAISLSNFTASAFTVASGSSGITNIGIDEDEDAPVIYYNYQGMRINNPSKGQLLIKVQGKNATKIVY